MRGVWAPFVLLLFSLRRLLVVRTPIFAPPLLVSLFSLPSGPRRPGPWGSVLTPPLVGCFWFSHFNLGEVFTVEAIDVICTISNRNF